MHSFIFVNLIVIFVLVFLFLFFLFAGQGQVGGIVVGIQHLRLKMPLRIVLKPFIPVVLKARAEAEQAGMHTTSEAA